MKTRLRSKLRRRSEPRPPPSPEHVCPKCGKLCHFKELLKRHIKAKHTSKLPCSTCQVCGKSFRNPSNFQTHIMTHAKREQFECEICKASFTSRSALRNHSKIHPRPRQIPKSIKLVKGKPYLQCQDCDGIYAKEWLLKKHQETVHGKYFPTSCQEETEKKLIAPENSDKSKTTTFLFLCSTCNTSFESPEALQEHSSYCQNKRFQCQNFNDSFPNELLLNEHRETSHAEPTLIGESDQNPNQSDGNYCPVDLTVSSTNETQISNFQICEGTFASVQDLRIHSKTHIMAKDKDFPCKDCQLSFASEQLLSEHQENFHRMTPVLIMPIETDQTGSCSDRATNEAQKSSPFLFELLNKLENAFHRESLGTRKELKITPGIDSASEINEKSTETEATTNQAGDLLISTLPDNSLPDLRLNSSSNAGITEVKNFLFECHYCDRTFPSNLLLNGHQETLHGKIADNFDHIPKDQVQPGTSGKSDQTTAAKVDLAETSESRKSKPVFPCTICNLSFSFLSALQAHCRKHAKGKNYQCNDCECKFNKKWILIEHQRTVHGKLWAVINKRKTSQGQDQSLNKSIKKFNCVTEIKEAGKSDEDEQLLNSSFLCSICKTSFSSILALQAHSKSHKNNSVKCKLCERSFSNKWLLDGHRETFHGLIRTIKRKDNLGKAEIEPIQRNVNTDQSESDTLRISNEAVTESVPVLPKNSESKLKKPVFSCSICKLSFSFNSALQAHVKKHAKVKKYHCKQCERSFTTKCLLNMHQETFHWKILEIKPIAIFGQSNSPSFSVDIKDCSETDKIPEANRVESSNSEQPTEPSFPCSICKISFLDRSALQAHSKNHASVTSYHCQDCDRSFPNNWLLNGHQATFHEKIPQNENFNESQTHIQDVASPSKASNSQSLLVQPSYPCSICNISFSSMFAMQAHFRHHNKKFYKCKYCERSFPNKWLLNGHQETFHGKIRAIKHRANHDHDLTLSCVKKSNEASTEAGQPKQSFSQPEKPLFPCCICKKVFLFNSVLQAHLRKHAKYMRYNCKDCDRSFPSKWLLSGHQETFHDKPPTIKHSQPEGNSESNDLTYNFTEITTLPKKQLLFDCGICKISFSFRSALRMHSWTHATKKKLQCKDCELSFSGEKLLNYHHQTFHFHRKVPANGQATPEVKISESEQSKPVEMENSIFQEAARRAQPKKLKCLKCKLHFAHRQLLKQHQVKFHKKTIDVAMEKFKPFESRTTPAVKARIIRNPYAKIYNQSIRFRKRTATIDSLEPNKENTVTITQNTIATNQDDELKFQCSICGAQVLFSRISNHMDNHLASDSEI